MEPTIRRLLLAWLALLAALLLSQQLALRLSDGLLVAVTVGSPVVAGLLLRPVAFGLREAIHRWRVLRQAANWKRPRPTDDEWLTK